MRYVVDASVAIKWFFQSAPDEADVPIWLSSATAIKAISGKAHTQVSSVRGDIESVRGEPVEP